MLTCQFLNVAALKAKGVVTRQFFNVEPLETKKEVERLYS